MRIQINLMYVLHNGKRGLYDENGLPVSLDTLLKQFHPTEGAGVPIRLIADDGRHQEIPFDLATAKTIVGQKMKAYFSIPDGRKVTVYCADAKGDYPILGRDPSGYPCTWDRNGIPSDGNLSMRLLIHTETAEDERGKDEAEAPENEE